MSCVFTVDHRFGDASLSLKFIGIIRDYIEDPENFKLDNYPDSIPYDQEERVKRDWLK